MDVLSAFSISCSIPEDQGVINNNGWYDFLPRTFNSVSLGPYRTILEAVRRPTPHDNLGAPDLFSLDPPAKLQCRYELLIRQENFE